MSMSKDFLEFKDHEEATRAVSEDVRADNFPLNTVNKNSGPSSNDPTSSRFLQGSS